MVLVGVLVFLVGDVGGWCWWVVLSVVWWVVVVGGSGGWFGRSF